MVWRGSPKSQDKLFACLTYLVPLIEVIPFGMYLFMFFPPLLWLLIPLSPLLRFYYLGVGGFPIVALAIFIWLYAGVAQNPKLIHFLRYNAMQALLLSVFAALCRLVLSLFGISQQAFSGVIAGDSAWSGSLLGNTISILIFLFVAGSSFYSIFQCIRGLYPEVPVISEQAYAMVR
ncbi:MAG: hypothetical protein IGR93_12110 [Hydrococcus sp. C42_A2020_068]|uniref:Tic20 family protein n=1 Tax=Pleurocapsa sp. PCC 7327 TaxID=118163 RepID=UPI00029F8D46|nr:Tic20 family protein [Pleurocapsa sp. PCC 7327]AFY76899.1 hypothetical protein Ple7327_1523 [Pleurocapsa sp. PCC 7327]MBF2020818.1 hypothetical protein [Hydrococcus sp. C42_A2020_068]